MMHAWNTRIRALFALALTASLAACISVLPKPGPDPDIFRLSDVTLPERMAASPVIVLEMPMAPKALRNNRIAIAQGPQDIAYAAGARWAGMVPQMAQELLNDALLATGRLNVVSPREGVHPPFGLAVEVRHFEAVYDQGPASVPLGRVSLYAKLIDRRGRTLIAQKIFTADVRARENTLRAMAAAIDAAAHEAADVLAGWTAEQTRAFQDRAG